MRSCERPPKRSARNAVPLSVSKRYALSIRTQGSSCRRRASSSLRRVSAFSASSSSSRAASHSSRVPVLWLVCFSPSLCSSPDRRCFYERRILALKRLDRTAAPALRHGLRHWIREDVLLPFLHAVEDGLR